MKIPEKSWLSVGTGPKAFGTKAQVLATIVQEITLNRSCDMQSLQGNQPLPLGISSASCFLSPFHSVSVRCQCLLQSPPLHGHLKTTSFPPALVDFSRWKWNSCTSNVTCTAPAAVSPTPLSPDLPWAQSRTPSLAKIVKTDLRCLHFGMPTL